MSQLQLKDGSFREFTPGQSAAEIVKGIGMGLYKAACCVKINGEVCDLRTPVTEDCTFEVCTFDDPDVPQDPTDEPASELLKRINPKAEITCDNGHYQKLPKGWCECKLSDVCVFDNGYAFSSDNYNDCGIPLIRISNITNTGSIDLSSCVFIQDVKSNKFIVKSGDLLIAMSGATTGKMGVYLYEEDALLNQRVGNLKCTDVMLQQYRNYYMFAKSDYILKIAYGGAQPNISAKAILDIDVMLPPLKEQHRIVAKIEEIFAQLDAIEASL